MGEAAASCLVAVGNGEKEDEREIGCAVKRLTRWYKTENIFSVYLGMCSGIREDMWEKVSVRSALVGRQN